MSTYDWLKHYRESTNSGNIDWYDFDVVPDIKLNSTTKAIEEKVITLKASGRMPNSREVHITFIYKYIANDATAYGLLQEPTKSLKLFIVDNKKTRVTHDEKFTKSSYANGNCGLPSWIDNLKLTIKEIINYRKRKSTYMTNLDSKSYALFEWSLMSASKKDIV